MTVRRSTRLALALIGSFIVWGILIGGETRGANIEKEVWEILTGERSGSGYTSELLAELGKPAVPVLMNIVENGQFDFPQPIVRALGWIGDEKATPLLLEMLSGNFTYRSEHRVTKRILFEALGRIGDPRAESKVLEIFNDQNERVDIRLLAMWTLCKIGSGDRVKEFLTEFHNMYERWYFWDDEETKTQIRNLGLPLAVCEDLPEFYLALKDENLLIKGLRNRWFGEIGDPRFNEACHMLADEGSSKSIEALFQLAESDKAMLPAHLPEGEPESWYEKYESVPPLIRMNAVESLLTIPGVDINRVRRAFEGISVEGLPYIPLTVKFQPDKWNIHWKKAKVKTEEDDDDEEEGKITCYLGNIPGGYSVRDIIPETILLDGKVSLSQIGKKGKIQARIKRRCQGFIGKVLEVKFNKFEAINSLKGIWPGKECNITITGELRDGKPFKGTGKIKIGKPGEEDEDEEDDEDEGERDEEEDGNEE